MHLHMDFTQKSSVDKYMVVEAEDGEESNGKVREGRRINLEGVMGDGSIDRKTNKW